jgi:hypothetical protein
MRYDLPSCLASGNLACAAYIVCLFSESDTRFSGRIVIDGEDAILDQEPVASRTCGDASTLTTGYGAL